MPTQAELEAKLAQLEKLKELQSLQEELAELEESQTLGGKAKTDVKSLLGGLATTSLDPLNIAKMTGQQVAQRAIAKAQGEAVTPASQSTIETLIGPIGLRFLAAASQGPAGPAIAAQSVPRQLEERPVSGSLELLGILGAAGGGVGFANRHVAARNARLSAPMERLLAEQPKQLTHHPATQFNTLTEGVAQAVTDRPGVLPGDPSTPLLTHSPAAQIAGPGIIEGPGFTARPQPLTHNLQQAQLSARRASVRAAQAAAEAHPEAAAHAFRKLAEKAAGGKKLSPANGAPFQMEYTGPTVSAKIVSATAKKPARVVAPEVPKGAIPIRGPKAPPGPGVGITPTLIDDVTTGVQRFASEVAESHIRRSTNIAGEAVDAFLEGQPSTLPKTKISAGDPFFTLAEDNIVWLQGGLGAVHGAFKIGAKNVFQFLREARKRGSTKPYGELMDLIENGADPLRESLAAKEFAKLRQAGLRKLPIEEIESLLADRIMGKLPQTPQSRLIREMFRRLRTRAVNAGIEMGDLGENYLRRALTDDVANVLFDDLAPLEAKYRALAMSEDAISADIQTLIGKNKMAPSTRKMLKHLVDTRQAKSLAAALKGLRREAGQAIFAEAGWEKARRYNLPAEFYEKNISKIMFRYINSWAKRVAEVETFGPKGEKAATLLKRIALEGGENEARLGRHVLDAWSGDIEFKKPMANWMRRWSNRYTAFAALTKIGFGFATLKNVFQTVISTASTAGWGRTLRGVFDTITSPEHRAFVRDASGALNRLAFEQLAGIKAVSKSGRAAEATLKATGFHHINVFNQYVAGVTATRFIPELHALANGQAVGMFSRVLKGSPGLLKARQAWARRMLKSMGVDHAKKLDDTQMNRGVYRFATDTQLQKNVVRDPISRTDPRFRAFWTLKGFGIRQFHFVKNQIIKEAFVHKNYAPIIRLGVGGYLAGEVEQFLEKHFRALLSGRPPQEKDQGPVMHFFDNLGAIGAWSLMTDIAAAESKMQAVRFMVTPIQVAEFEKGVQIIERVWKDSDMDSILELQERLPNKTTGEIFQSRIKDVSAFGGTFPREIAKRFQTEDQAKQELSRELGDVKDKLFRAAKRGDKKAVDRIYDAWMNNWPQRPLTYQDVGPRQFADWLIKKHQIENRGQLRETGLEAPSQVLRDR
jgi:hypothetical protein